MIPKKVAVLVPCYKRPEYTQKCLDAIVENTQNTFPYEVRFHLVDDGSQDGTNKILTTHPIHNDICARVYSHPDNWGLRRTIIEFFKEIENQGFDFISKVDNDCTVPKNWLTDILSAFERHSELAIASPNVWPSNAAFKYGRSTPGKSYRVADIVGGVWTMRAELIDGIMFEDYPADGITGAISVLRQIRIENRPVIGWLPDVIFQDIGHWSGQHPEHIKTPEHFYYSHEVGRPVAWTPQKKNA